MYTPDQVSVSFRYWAIAARAKGGARFLADPGFGKKNGAPYFFEGLGNVFLNPGHADRLLNDR
jgi:hypothetical protein